MAGHKKWADVRAKHVRTPEHEARIGAIRAAMNFGDVLAQIREQRIGSQKMFADQLGLSQARISQIESGQDLYLSTLRAYVEALGGELEMTVVFPDSRIELTRGAASN